jgi:prepilin-type N-terminal cleavage/methylation domain-containing protein
MRIKRPTSKAREQGHRASGFSLLEMIMVIVLILVMATITFTSMVPALKQQKLTNGYNTALAAMRQARDNAVAQRTSYSVTFSTSVTPNTIVVTPTLAGFQGAQSTATYQLPVGVAFYVTAPGTAAPDGFGTGSTPIDFGYTANGGTGGQSTVYFCPDGSAQDAENGAGNCAGSWDGGVVYISWVGSAFAEPTSSRAISLWGGTGRIHGWRLYPKSGGGYLWLRQ